MITPSFLKDVFWCWKSEKLWGKWRSSWASKTYLGPFLIWLVVWNMTFIFQFSWESSSQVMKSYFSEGFCQSPTRSWNIIDIPARYHHRYSITIPPTRWFFWNLNHRLRPQAPDLRLQFALLVHTDEARKRMRAPTRGWGLTTGGPMASLVDVYGSYMFTTSWPMAFMDIYRYLWYLWIFMVYGCVW